MLRFFSKIRYKLAAENSIARYLRYAFGEILLLVIGILIALQINNWNENRKLRNKETILLQAILENIDNNIKIINDDIQFNNKALISNEIVLDVIKNNKQYNDSLKFHFHNARILQQTPLSFSSYENLKSVGFDIIRSEPLKKEIIFLFDVIYHKNLDAIKEATVTISNAGVNQFMMAHFEELAFNNTIPNNFNNLIENQEYINILAIVNNIQNWSISVLMIA